MTDEDIKNFVIKNAGKMASGNVLGGIAHKGRITAYGYSARINMTAIVLEDDTTKDMGLPNPLPAIPYSLGGFNRVISPSRQGKSCYPDSVILISSTASTITSTSPSAAELVKNVCSEVEIIKPIASGQSTIDYEQMAKEVLRAAGKNGGRCSHKECVLSLVDEQAGYRHWCHYKYAGIIDDEGRPRASGGRWLLN